MFKIGEKLTRANYTQGAVWCNQNHAFVNSDWVIEAVPEPSIADQNQAIRRLREQLFVTEADPIKHDYDEAVARGEAEQAATFKAQWLAAKDAIRAANPYLDTTEPISSTEQAETTGEQ